jgi:hypothetical protein
MSYYFYGEYGYEEPQRAPAPPAVVKAQLGPESHLMDDLLLAPCLTTRDLLSLSEAATWLLSYRNQLKGVKIEAWRDGVTPAMLMAQKCLHTLHVGTGKPLLELTAYLRGEGGATTGATLCRLILKHTRHKPDLDTVVEGLGALLAEGGCPALQELDFSSMSVGRAAASHLCKGLAGCAELRYLHVPYGRVYLMAVAEALERGVWPKLRVLGLPTSVDYEAWDAVVKALHACPRPALRDLRVRLAPGATGLGDALRGGACRGLQSLKLEGSLSAAADALADALREGACPDLTELRLTTTGLGPQGVRALSEAVPPGGLASLEELEVMDNSILDEGVVALAEALGEGACPRLRRLSLPMVGMGDEGCKAVAQAVREGGLPSLQRLDLFNNQIGDIGVEALIEAVEARPETNLLEIGVHVNEAVSEDSKERLMIASEERFWTALDV